MVRIKDGNYINKAKRYFESREHRELFDGELKVCQIPSMIGVLDE